MTLLTGVVRRVLWLLVIGLAGGALFQWWRERQAPSAPAAPEWPPIEVAPHATNVAMPTEPALTTEETASVEAAEPEATVGAASIVNALVDAPEARSTAGDGAAWVDPDESGGCPVEFPIKANDNSGIFHVPGGRFYDRTKAERCYADADAAIADGYRRAKS